MDGPYFFSRPCPLLVRKFELEKKPRLNPDQIKIIGLLESHQYRPFFESLRDYKNDRRSSFQEIAALTESAFLLENNNIKLINHYASQLNADRKHQEAWDLLSSIDSIYWNRISYICASRALNGLGRAEECSRLLQKLPSDQWDPQTYTNAAIAFNMQRRYSETGALADRLPREKWNNQLYLAVMIACEVRGEHEKVITLGNELRSQRLLEPRKTCQVYGLMVSSYNALQQYHEALATAGKIPQSDWVPQLLNSVMIALHALNKYDEIIALKNMLPKKGSRWSFSLAAKACNAQKRYRETVELLDQFPRGKWDLHLYSLYTTALNALGKNRETIAALESIPGNEWDNFIRSNYATALNGMGHFAQAWIFLNRIPKSSWDRHLYSCAASALNSLDDHQRAWQLLALFPRDRWDPHIYSCAANALIGMERYEEVIGLLNGFSPDKSRWDTHFFNAAAMAYVGLKKYREALDVLGALAQPAWDDNSRAISKLACDLIAHP